jgi:hypothetical protein
LPVEPGDAKIRSHDALPLRALRLPTNVPTSVGKILTLQDGCAIRWTNFRCDLKPQAQILELVLTLPGEEIEGARTSERIAGTA